MNQVFLFSNMGDNSPNHLENIVSRFFTNSLSELFQNLGEDSLDQTIQYLMEHDPKYYQLHVILNMR